MSSLVPLSHIKDETIRMARIRGQCWRVAVYEVVKGYADKTIASRMGWSVGRLELFKTQNALVFAEAQERLSKVAAERIQGSRLALRVGVAKRLPEALRAYDRAFEGGTITEQLRAADSLANRIDPIKHQTEVSIAELSQKTMAILSRGHEEMGEMIQGEVELIGDGDAE